MSAFRALSLEALRDAARRRGLVAAALASAIAAIAIQRCGHCEANISLQGEMLNSAGSDWGAISTIATCAWIALWTYAIAALLASDGLANALEDGSAESVLSRPVSRDTLALAHLSGAWLGTFAIGAALTALAAGIAVGRYGLAAAPALLAIVAIGSGVWCVAAAAMLASLSLPRTATLLLLTVLGVSVAAVEVAALLGAEETGLPGWIARWGPAWVAAPVHALAPWLAQTALPGPPSWPLIRSLGWAALVTAALIVRFRTTDLPR